MQATKEKLEAEERERAAIEAKIIKQLNICRGRVGPNVNSAVIEECLGPVLALNPDHPQIVELRARVEQIVSDRLIRQQKEVQYQSLVGQLQRSYNEALSVHKSGNRLRAIQAYGTVVKSGLPDPRGLKELSKRQIASIQN